MMAPTVAPVCRRIPTLRVRLRPMALRGVATIEMPTLASAYGQSVAHWLPSNPFRSALMVARRCPLGKPGQALADVGQRDADE